MSNKKSISLQSIIIKYKNQIFWSLFAVVFLIAIFFRFYNTPQKYGFDPDPVRDGIITSYAAENFKFPLTGPVSGIAPFTFGPWYYYFLIVFRIIFPFDYAPFYLIGIFSLGFVMVMYKIGEELEGRYFGLILAFITAISPAQTGPSAGLSNPNMVPLHAGLTIFFGIQYFNKKIRWYWILLWGLVYGIGVNHHYQMVGLILIPFLVIILKKHRRLIDILYFSIGTVISFIPLLIFNMTNNWHTLRGITFYIFEGKNISYIPNSWSLYVKSFFLPFWAYLYGFQIILGTILLIVCSLALILVFIKGNLKRIYLILFGVLFLHLIVLRYAIAQREYYYYLFLLPILYLLACIGFWFLKYIRFGKIAIVISLVFLFFQTLPANIERIQNNTYQEEYKKISNILNKNFPDKKISVFACSVQNRQTNFARGIVFMLNNQNKFDDYAVKVGFVNEDCRFLYDKYEIKTDIENPAYKKYAGFNKIENIGGVNLNRIQDEELRNDGWIKINPKSVYRETLNVNNN